MRKWDWSDVFSGIFLIALVIVIVCLVVSCGVDVRNKATQVVEVKRQNLDAVGLNSKTEGFFFLRYGRLTEGIGYTYVASGQSDGMGRPMEKPANEAVHIDDLGPDERPYIVFYECQDDEGFIDECPKEFLPEMLRDSWAARNRWAVFHVPAGTVDYEFKISVDDIK